MTDSIIERACRALCDGGREDDTEGGPHDAGIWLEEGKPWWTGYVDQVRTVLQAIREPSETMAKAGGENGGWSDWYDGPGEDREQATEVWQAMIDAALDEK